MWFSSLFAVKMMHLADRTDLLKISNLIYGREKIVRSLYSTCYTIQLMHYSHFNP